MSTVVMIFNVGGRPIIKNYIFYISTEVNNDVKSLVYSIK